MILPRELNPEKSLYVIGARVLGIIDDYHYGAIDVYVLYEFFKKKYPKKISFNYFLYALDWLFIINSITLNGNKVQKCS